jgi:hypothetical protein
MHYIGIFTSVIENILICALFLGDLEMLPVRQKSWIFKKQLILQISEKNYSV